METARRLSGFLPQTLLAELACGGCERSQCRPDSYRLGGNRAKNHLPEDQQLVGNLPALELGTPDFYSSFSHFSEGLLRGSLAKAWGIL